MTIRICHSQGEWEAWQSAQGGEFLQSWDWGEFQRMARREPIRLQMVEVEEVVGQVQGFVYPLPLGLKYIYLPRIPLLTAGCQSLWDFFHDQGYVFARIEPTSDSHLSPITYNLSPTNNRQPQYTLIIDLQKSEEELLAAMHPKTRYNIHLAEKKGVIISEKKDADIFWRLNEETTTRDRFKSHDRRYYETMLSLPICYQLTAYHGLSPIASHILVVYGGTCTYIHGASSSQDRALMAPYLLQWQGILLGQNFGCRVYDFWGVAPENQKSKIKDQKFVETCFHNYCWEAIHPWTGMTRFKAGFGGVPRSYPQAVDIVFQPLKYRMYQLARRLRGICKWPDRRGSDI